MANPIKIVVSCLGDGTETRLYLHQNDSVEMLHHHIANAIGIDVERLRLFTHVNSSFVMLTEPTTLVLSIAMTGGIFYREIGCL